MAISTMITLRKIAMTTAIRTLVAITIEDDNDDDGNDDESDTIIK